MRKLFAIIAFVVALQVVSVQGQTAKTGPFGFYRGETVDQVAAAVGPSSITQEVSKGTQISLVSSTAPKPYSGTDGYILFFSKSQGLLKIVRVGDTLDVNNAGDQLKSAFHDSETALISVYGEPYHQFDFLKADAHWTEPQFWMEALSAQEYVLASYWTASKTTLPNQLSTITVEAVARNVEHGYIGISYEFVGWNEFVDQRDAEDNRVL